MRRKLIFVVGCLAIASIVAVAFAANSGSRPRPASHPAKAQAQADNPPPARVVYRFFFRHLLSLKHKAAEIQSRGGNSFGLENYYRNEAHLTDDEVRILEEIAADSVREVEEIDAQAKVITDELRAQFPGGRMPARIEGPPPPSPELERLQEQRDAAMTRAYDRLRTELGDQKFQTLDSVVQRRIGANLTTVAPTMRRPGLSPAEGQRRQPAPPPAKQSGN
ncbi:MAG TPA: hypothetical protein VJ302_04415 [Blastocatellia bacterium]|nr:hypothetical protein [Blastocatellia bacterium]